MHFKRRENLYGGCNCEISATSQLFHIAGLNFESIGVHNWRARARDHVRSSDLLYLQ